MPDNPQSINRKPKAHRGAPLIGISQGKPDRTEHWDRRKRVSPSKRGYDSRWRKFRDWYLNRNPVCVIREKCNGAAASEVDHIKTLRQGGARLDTSNVQAACKPCHSWKTATQDRN